MNKYKVTLYVNEIEVDYIEFKTDSLESAKEYAEPRFRRAYPQSFAVGGILKIEKID